MIGDICLIKIPLFSFQYKHVLGNKCDMEDQRVIPKESGEAVANANDALFLETSAKANINIEEAFEQLAERILQKTILEDEKELPTQTLSAPNVTMRQKGKSCCK